jgi:hypothetical protein
MRRRQDLLDQQPCRNERQQALGQDDTSLEDGGSSYVLIPHRNDDQQHGKCGRTQHSVAKPPGQGCRSPQPKPYRGTSRWPPPLRCRPPTPHSGTRPSCKLVVHSRSTGGEWTGVPSQPVSCGRSMPMHLSVPLPLPELFENAHAIPGEGRGLWRHLASLARLGHSTRNSQVGNTPRERQPGSSALPYRSRISATSGSISARGAGSEAIWTWAATRSKRATQSWDGSKREG